MRLIDADALAHKIASDAERLGISTAQGIALIDMCYSVPCVLDLTDKGVKYVKRNVLGLWEDSDGVD